MFEGSVSSIPSILAYMNSWLNPHFFFLLLNLMIGTIAFTSTFNNRHQHHQKQENQNEEIQQQQSSSIPTPNQIGSTDPIGSEEFEDPPSSIQTRVDTLQDLGTHFTKTLTIDPQETNFGKEDAAAPTLDDVYAQAVVNKSSRTTPELVKESSEIPMKSKGRMKKSVSMKAEITTHLEAEAKPEAEEEDSIEARRPATMREGRGKMAEKDEYEVDARAADFINKFKQQQRMDSIGRKREIRIRK